MAGPMGFRDSSVTASDSLMTLWRIMISELCFNESGLNA